MRKQANEELSENDKLAEELIDVAKMILGE